MYGGDSDGWKTISPHSSQQSARDASRRPDDVMFASSSASSTLMGAFEGFENRASVPPLRTGGAPPQPSQNATAASALQHNARQGDTSRRSGDPASGDVSGPSAFDAFSQPSLEDSSDFMMDHLGGQVSNVAPAEFLHALNPQTESHAFPQSDQLADFIMKNFGHGEGAYSQARSLQAGPSSWSLAPSDHHEGSSEPWRSSQGAHTVGRSHGSQGLQSPLTASVAGPLQRPHRPAALDLSRDAAREGQLLGVDNAHSGGTRSQDRTPSRAEHLQPSADVFVQSHSTLETELRTPQAPNRFYNVPGLHPPLFDGQSSHEGDDLGHTTEYSGRLVGVNDQASATRVNDPTQLHSRGFAEGTSTLPHAFLPLFGSMHGESHPSSSDGPQDSEQLMHATHLGQPPRSPPFQLPVGAESHTSIGSSPSTLSAAFSQTPSRSSSHSGPSSTPLDYSAIASGPGPSPAASNPSRLSSRSSFSELSQSSMRSVAERQTRPNSRPSGRSGDWQHQSFADPQSAWQSFDSEMGSSEHSRHLEEALHNMGHHPNHEQFYLASTAGLAQRPMEYDMAYADHNLAHALAANAHIGSQTNRDGGSTPTIMEEDEGPPGTHHSRGQHQLPLVSHSMAPQAGSLIGHQQAQQMAAQHYQPSLESAAYPNVAHHASQQPLSFYFGEGGHGGGQLRFDQGSPNRAQRASGAASSPSGSRRSAFVPSQTVQAASGRLGVMRSDGFPVGHSGLSGIGPARTAVVLKRAYRPGIHPSTLQQASFLRMASNPTMSPALSGDAEPTDCLSFISDTMDNYLSSSSRLGLGERTVLVMTSKVGQKSYGVEKRFLCPPPMVVLIGSSWWTSAQKPTPTFVDGPGTMSEHAMGVAPPRVVVSISGEQHSIQDGSLEWAANSGRLIDVSGNGSTELAISGRCIAKQLFINDLDEKRRYCEANVTISMPGRNPDEHHLLGHFPSKQIKVISKPSKKRQSARNADLCVNHGTTISLFHRLRGQTVSTRYLCVSGAPTWLKGSDGQTFTTAAQETSLPSTSEPPSCFMAKISSWDAFIVYLVDPAKSTLSHKATPESEAARFPTPPECAYPATAYGAAPRPIHYNQPVVLQCLQTGVVSPVMVIRRVDKGTTVMGGSRTFGSEGFYPCSEALGDPVSQLHKIALEVLDNFKVPAPDPNVRHPSGELRPPGDSRPFLSCNNDQVGMRNPDEPRRWVPNVGGISAPTTPITPMTFPQHDAMMLDESKKFLGTPPTSPTAATAAAYAAAQTRHSVAQARHQPSIGSGLSMSSNVASQGVGSASQESGASTSSAADSSKARRPRRVSSSVIQHKERAAQNAASKSRRRGQSMSTVNHIQQLSGTGSASGTSSPGKGEHLRRTSSFATSAGSTESSVGGPPAGSTWSIEVKDTDIWTIVGTDIARHTFYIPPRIVDGIRPKAPKADRSVAHLITVPTPREPITPIPVLHHFTAPQRTRTQFAHTASPASRTTSGSEWITLFGENFGHNLFVYFGDWRCDQVERQSTTTWLCAPPPSHDVSVGGEVLRGPSPITLVRHDGVIFPTDHIYRG
ncbi:LAG1-DNAbind-domain-containing protein [Ceraceosorus guamensis]|uniref:LAG1-DNAbind-domain-containing protein n=1 Tax=Ceraceosorus guamensis TaxID=1522189 RepID=A0A316VW66_9BASI|nr:LAG1-DNAbind-domain-containing protein [Ceraceosorus guamensis]PWN40673.1 LAG1-DNAbind-domain-containing protein [Ceraceosorus guamensis]